MPSQREAVQQIMDSGVESLKLNTETVTLFSSPRKTVRTNMDICSLDLGVIPQEQYRYIARRTSQGDQLFERHLKKVLEMIPELSRRDSNLGRVTLPAYGRQLKNNSLCGAVFDALAAAPAVSASKICIELSADLLFEEDLPRLTEEIRRVRNLGVAVALMELGDPYCPLLRLFEIPFDYAFLDRFAVSSGGDRQDDLLQGLCSLLHTGKTTVIAPGLTDSAQITRVRRLGCDGFSMAPGIEVPDDE